jgi:hypothetical protein
MKTIPMAAGLAMALALAEPGLTAESVPNVHTPCPILRPMARCPLEGHRIEANAPAVSSRRSA